MVKNNYIYIWKKGEEGVAMGSLGEGDFQQRGEGRGGWLFRRGGGFRQANLHSRLSETLSYLPESLPEPQLLRILPRDDELNSFHGRDALHRV